MARSLFPTVILLILLQGSCAGPPIPIVSPQAPGSNLPPAADYIPKKAYHLEFSAAWEGALQALRETNMPLTLQDRDRGIIRTDYIKGPDIQRPKKALSTRYKYNLFFFKESERRTILNVRCLYEIKEKSGPSFGNGNDLYPDEVIILEKDLYRVIESSLLPLEASKRAGPRGEDRITPPASPAVPGPGPSSERPKEKETIIFPPPAAAAVPAAPRPKETPAPPPAPSREIQVASPPPAPSPAKEVAPGAPRPEPGAKVISPKPKILLITKMNANLREEPSPQSKIILTLKPGRKVEKIGESGNWVQIRIWGTTTGWLQKELLGEAPP